MTHWIRGAQRLSRSSKKRVACLAPEARSSRCAFSTAPLAAVAASMSFACNACVRSLQSLRLSYGSCASSGATHLGATALPFFCTSNSVRFSPVWVSQCECHGGAGVCGERGLDTLVALNSISALHRPLTSPRSVEPCRTRPARAL